MTSLDAQRVGSHPGLTPCSSNDSARAPSEVDTRVEEVAQRALKKVAIAFAINVAVIAFVAQPAFSVWVFTAGLATVLIDAYVNFVAVRLLFGNQQTRLRRLGELGDLSIVNTLSLTGPGLLIHELGHFLAALACYRNARPSIHIDFMRRGHTDCNMRSALSKFGQMLGGRSSLLLVMGAGFLASTVWALLEYAVAYFTQEAHPTLSHFLSCQATCQILNELCFGIVTLLGSPMVLGNDYITLEMLGGIHPLTTMVAMVLTVAVEHLLLGALDEVTHREAPPPDLPMHRV